MSKFEKFITLLEKSGDPDFIKMAENAVAAKKEFDAGQTEDQVLARSYVIEFSADTDDDFQVEGEVYDFLKTFSSETLDGVVEQFENWATDEKTFTSWSPNNRHLPYWKRDCVPEMIEKIKAGENYYHGGNWDISAEITTPKKDADKLESEKFSLFGITLG